MYKKYRCIVYIVLLTILHKLMLRNESHKERWLKLVNKKCIKSKWKVQCLLEYLFKSALLDLNTKRICEAFEGIISTSDNPRFRESSVIAVFESAVWEKNEKLLETLSDKIEARVFPISDNQKNRLQRLREWRFNLNKDLVFELLSPSTPDNPQIQYVHYFAKGVLAEAWNRKDSAINYYKKAMVSMPTNCPEYKRAEESCNYLLNN